MIEFRNIIRTNKQIELEREVGRRRTFAIISHPDAGKTTLTEKLLLYAGAIELAGAVRGRKARRHAGAAPLTSSSSVSGAPTHSTPRCLPISLCEELRSGGARLAAAQHAGP